MKTFLLPGIALAALLALTGCVGGAQNNDPSGDSPGELDNRTSPAQANKNSCDLASDATLAALTDASSEGPARVGWIAKGDGAFYIAAPLGANGILSDTLGLWVSKQDPGDDDFDSELQAVNADAKAASSFAPASSTFSESSSAGKEALSCATETDD